MARDPRQRNRRAREVRAHTLNCSRLTKAELKRGRELYPDVDDVVRPARRSECIGGARPCPFVACKYNLYLDVQTRGRVIKFNFPDLEPDEMTESCVLDVADRGGATLDLVGVILNVTRERIRQIERKAKAKIFDAAETLR